MGSGSSKSETKVNFDLFFTQNEKPYFYVYPEEEIVNQKFKITKSDVNSHQKKENYIFTANVINEIFLNPLIFTQEESEFNLLTNIIIPQFSKCLLINNSEFIDSKLIFQFHESLNRLFFERHNQLLLDTKYIKNPPITYSDTTSSLEYETPDDFHKALKSDLQKMKQPFLFFSFKSPKTNVEKILKFIDENPLNAKLLYDSFLWSILNSNLTLFLTSCQKILLFDFKKNEKSLKIFSKFNFPALLNNRMKLTNILIQSDLTEGYINYNNAFGLPNSPRSRTNIIAASPLYLLVLNSYSKSFILTKLSNHFTTEADQHFENINLNGFCITALEGAALIYSSSSKIFIFDYASKTTKSVKQTAKPLLAPPFASDGHFIYSIVSQKEIGVYFLDDKSHELRLTKTISVRFNKNSLSPPFNDQLLSSSLIDNASIVTNGIVLQLILPERKEINKIIHFSRVISLIDGSHIRDFRFQLSYPINGISFDPLSKCLWAISGHPNGACFIRFKYTGPEPLWMSNSIMVPNMHLMPNNIQFLNFLICYSHSTLCQFFGSDIHSDQSMVSFLADEMNPRTTDMILSFLENETNDNRFTQLLFAVLSYQIKYNKMSKEQDTKLFSILSNYFSKESLFNFLILFVVNIADRLDTTSIRQYFGLIFKHLDLNNPKLVFRFLGLLFRFEKSHKFPYILDNNCNIFMNKILSRLCNERASNEEVNLLLIYQSSLFNNYARIAKKKSPKKNAIELAALGYSQNLIEYTIVFLNELNSFDKFVNSSLISIFRKLLVLLKVSSASGNFVWPLLSNILEIMKIITKKSFFKVDINNPLYLFFMEILFHYIYSFKQVLSFSDLDILKKYSNFLNIKIEKEKTVNEIFNQQLTDDDFIGVINTLYTKVANPLNRRLTPEDKEVEKYLFLSLFYKTQIVEEIINLSNKIKAKEQIQIPQEIRQVAQAVYGIRSNLRSKKQNEDQTEYIKLHKNVVEKSHFLLKYQSPKRELKEISSFINSNIPTSEILLAQSNLESVKQKFSLFIHYSDSFISQKLPINAIYLFVMHITENSDIFNTFDLVKDYVEIEQNSCKQLILDLLNRIGQIPPNPLLSLVFNLIIILTKSYKEEQVHNLIFELLKEIISKVCQASKALYPIVFKSCISIICHFHRVLNQEKFFIIKEEEREILSNLFQDLDLKSSMSLTIEHSLYQGLFSHLDNINLINNIFGFIGQPKFHKLSILLYDQMKLFARNGQENEFLSYMISIFYVIGTVLSGGNCNNLLQVAVPLSELDQSPENTFCRTPLSQLACILELIQIVRRLINEKDPKVIQMIQKHFRSISINELDKPETVKQFFALFAVMSNFIEIKRPYTIVINEENKNYFITKLDEQNNSIEGILLPITDKQAIKHTFEKSQDLKSFELIQYKFSMFSDIQIPFDYFKAAADLTMTKYSDCLFTFYALQCVKENILDPEHGAEFSDTFFSVYKNINLDRFMFNKNSHLITTLLKKSLTSQTDGIFVGSVVKSKMFHASFTQLVFNDDYVLTDNLLRAKNSSHVFVSSILNDKYPIYFTVNIDDSDSHYDFGVIIHSVNQNQSLSIMYSTLETGFCINGEKVQNAELKPGSIFECRYLPAKNKVSFADSINGSRLFSYQFSEQFQCSFIALIYPQTSLNYSISLSPSTDVFKKTLKIKQIVKPKKFIKRIFNKITSHNEAPVDEDATNYSMMSSGDYAEVETEIVNYKSKAIKKYVIDDRLFIAKMNSEFDLSDFYTFATFDDLRETPLKLAVYPNAFYSSLSNIYSSPFLLQNFIQINEVSGRFNLVPCDEAMISSENSIPPFHFDKYHHLPVEVINCYFSGICKNHRQEILTLLAVRVIGNSNDVAASLNQFMITPKMVVNLVVSILVLLEPIKLNNLDGNKSPIDFETFNGFETCVKLDLYDYYSCLTKIYNHFQENDKKSFINEWFEKLENNFRSKYMHFATHKNSNIIVVRSSIVDTYQTFNIEDVSGWIIFPFKFGCYKLPSLSFNNQIFPKSKNESANYACSEGKVLKIMLKRNNRYEDVNMHPIGILPFFNDSNESLFYSFFQLAISFKYFVLFSHADINYDMKLQLRKMVFDSIVSGSPFFYTHSDTILPFIHNKLNVPFSKNNITMLNTFFTSVSHLQNNGISQFITQQMSLFDDLKASKYKYFISDSEPAPRKIELPEFSIEPTISEDKKNSEPLFLLLTRVLLPKDKQFPFHLILSEWFEAFSHYPPCEVEHVTSNIISVKFLAYIPQSFQLFESDFKGNEEVHIFKTNDFTSTNYKKETVNHISTNISDSYLIVTPEMTTNKIYIKFPHYEDISQHYFLVYTNFYKNNPKIAFECRSFFQKDINEWTQDFTIDDDQQILKRIDVSAFRKQSINTRPSNDIMVGFNNLVHKAHLNYVRYIFLVTLNFMFAKNKSLLEVSSDQSIKQFLSVHFLSDKFKTLVQENSHFADEYSCHLEIDRQEGHKVRNGISNKTNKSLIGQFAEKYEKHPENFRNYPRPFYIRYVKEEGIDCGGLTRDFSSELIKDINSPRVGLFIQTPNGRNHEGKHQECFVPSPAAVIMHSNKYYRAVGALIAILIRTEMRQPDLMFPPLLWNFLVTGELRIEQIYEIDKSYKVVVSNLTRGAAEMSDEDFNNSLSSVQICNLRGEPINFQSPSFFRTHSIQLNKANCGRYISMCNELRINELKLPLESIRAGFWENLNFGVPQFATGPLIEFLACGEKIITVKDLKKVTTFLGVSRSQQSMFWNMVTRLNNEDRKNLLSFSTGLSTIKEEGLKVDPLFTNRPDALLPTASTCFFTLHLPEFSSVETMYRAFSIAIHETGSFENS